MLKERTDHTNDHGEPGSKRAVRIETYKTPYRNERYARQRLGILTNKTMSHPEFL